MAERDFETSLHNGTRAEDGWHLVPIPDFPRNEKTRFLPARVYDMGLVHAGTYHGCELKQVTRSVSWPIRDLKPHQEGNLQEAWAAGGVGWVIVHFCVPKLSARQQKLRNATSIDRAFAVLVQDVVAARQHGHTGLPIEWWETHGLELTRNEAGWSPAVLANVKGERP